MNAPDELEGLWKAQPVDSPVRGEEMRKIVLNRMEKFDRAIRRRNMREMIAAAAVAAFFTYISWGQPNGIARVGSFILVAGSLWIIFYTWRYGAEPPEPNPGQTLAAYQEALVRKYDHQIRLLRNVKFWYLAPSYLGLLTLSAGMMKQRIEKGAFTWVEIMFPIFYTLVFGGIWWLNEIYSVRKLEGMRARVMSGAEHGDVEQR